MSYQVLARKWRPRNFSELAGQEHVQRALINALESDRLHHAFLFTGTRGVGKTTIARILAKSLNCEKGISATPCGECSACREINEGRFVDLIEVDAASKTKVEDTRDLLENVQYVPTRGRYKVYLIDEVHMLSTHSFNALLKTLEEPPPHVKFLLATTDPQKLPVTILSRCLQFNLKRLPPDLIAEHLEKILHQENLNFEHTAITLIAEAADGSMRDALSLLDQAIAYGGGELKETEVRTMLGTVDKTHVFELLQALANRDSANLLSNIEQLASHSADFESVLNEILSLLHRIALTQIAPDAIDEQAPEKAQTTQLAESISAEDTQLYYQIGLLGKRDLPLAPNSKLGFEMVMLRMLAFQPVTRNAEQKPIAAKPRTTAQPAQSTPEAGAQTPPPQTQQTKSQHLEAISKTLGSTSPKKKLSSKDGNNTIPGNKGSDNKGSDNKPAAVEIEVTAATGSPKDRYTPLPIDENDWESLIENLSLTGVPLQLAKNCALLNCQDELIELALSESHKQFHSKQREEILQQALEASTGKKLKLTINFKDKVDGTPSLREQQRIRDRQAAAENDIYTDNNVKTIVETFDGRISTKSIRPVD
ncbi:DNA polymerase III subunit gamma/tau [Kaarinaea lacus]